ncbi:hypothetical protein F4803DRAFT_128064 [Xylaria telfairii]|nr:hypothetical protein F4803DRAFT_128064 [Xylaria telfairii]
MSRAPASSTRHPPASSRNKRTSSHKPDESNSSQPKAGTTRVPEKPISPDVKTFRFLQGIVDTRWNREKFRIHRAAHHIPFDAASLTKFVMSASMAARDPTSARINRFAERYAMHEKILKEKTSIETVEDMIDEYFDRIDEIFFFKLLSSKTTTGNGERRRLVIVDIKESMPGLDGLFHRSNDTLDISITDSRHKKHPLGALIVTLAHEMTHAYLEIFSDNRDVRHEEWLSDQKGHGKMFWILLKFIINNIFMFTRSNSFWEQSLKSEDEQYRCFDRTYVQRDK